MTLSTNLSNLRRDKQMFKYPARAAGSGSARWDRSRIRARVDAVPALKQVQKQRIVAGKTHYSRPATFVASEKNNRGAAASQPEPAAHRSRRRAVTSLPVVVPPPARSMIRRCQKQRIPENYPSEKKTRRPAIKCRLRRSEECVCV